MVVWCPACELEQFVESLAVNRLGPEGLVGATGANRLFDIHHLRIAFRETPRARPTPRKGAARWRHGTRSGRGGTCASSRTGPWRLSISSGSSRPVGVRPPRAT